MALTDSFLDQLDEVFAEFAELEERSRRENLDDVPVQDVVQFVVRARALVHRVSGTDSAYAEQCEDIRTRGGFVGYQARHLCGVVSSLREDVARGYLASQRELVHGELFADFLEMAQHLLSEGYKDAAAVVAGSSLEVHLRQLCEKTGIETSVDAKSGRVPKNADRMNADLTKGGAYAILDQKNVTSWLDLRNKAAHGRYDEYNADQVDNLIRGVREFMARIPA